MMIYITISTSRGIKMVAGYRMAGIKIPTELEASAREATNLLAIPFGTLIRVSLAMTAGYTREEALRKYYLDPTSKTARDLEAALRGHSETVLSNQRPTLATESRDESVREET